MNILIYRKSIIREIIMILLYISHPRDVNLSWDERLSGWCCDCVVGAKEVLQIICLILMMMKMMTMIMTMMLMVTTIKVMMMMVWW